MSDLIELRARIKATEADLAEAKVDLAEAKAKDKEQLVLVYEQKLVAYENSRVELLREKNRLEERAGALAGEYSPHTACF